jgi:hypothetical protein
VCFLGASWALQSAEFGFCVLQKILTLIICFRHQVSRKPKEIELLLDSSPLSTP